MILIFSSVESKKELDRVTLTEKSVKYQTGKARSTVNAMLARFGNRVAMEVLVDWSNGYVSLYEAPAQLGNTLVRFQPPAIR